MCRLVGATFRISTPRIEIHSRLLTPQLSHVEFYRGSLWVYSDDTKRPIVWFVAIVGPGSVVHLLRNMVTLGRRPSEHGLSSSLGI